MGVGVGQYSQGPKKWANERSIHRTAVTAWGQGQWKQGCHGGAVGGPSIDRTLPPCAYPQSDSSWSSLQWH